MRHFITLLVVLFALAPSAFAAELAPGDQRATFIVQWGAGHSTAAGSGKRSYDDQYGTITSWQSIGGAKTAPRSVGADARIDSPEYGGWTFGGAVGGAMLGYTHAEDAGRIEHSATYYAAMVNRHWGPARLGTGIAAASVRSGWRNRRMNPGAIVEAGLRTTPKWGRSFFDLSVQQRLFGAQNVGFSQWVADDGWGHEEQGTLRVDYNHTSVRIGVGWRL